MRSAFIKFSTGLVLCAWFLVTSAWAVSDKELTLDRPVVDQAHLLDAAAVKRIEQRLYAVRDSGLMQAAVVIVDSTEGVATFDYAMRLARRWQLGEAKADNGLLFLIAVQDRKFQIVTGKGLEGALPDVSIARIQRSQLVPAFRQGKYAQGIEHTLEALITQLEADADTRAQMIRADNQAKDVSALEQIMPSAVLIYMVCLVLANWLHAMKSAAIGGVAVASVGFIGLNLGVVSFVFGFFFFVFFMFSTGMRHSGSRPIIIGTGGGYSAGSLGGRSGYSGGGGGFSGGGAGGSW